MRRFLIWSAAGLAVILAAGLFVTRAVPDKTVGLSALVGDPINGEIVFTASGCASCHAADDAEGDAKRVLSGGHRLASDFGTFVAPNISMDATHGIGDWSLEHFASAVRAGVSPDGRHYYPAFPYASYAGMTDQDVVDRWTFMQTLPADATPSAPHEIGFPFNIRRAVGVWKSLFLSDEWVVADVPSPEIERGRYLVEVLAHCGECHTPRNALGGLDRTAWMAGAPNPSGRGTIPSLKPSDLTWSAADIAYYLETGFTPDFDSAGGSMADVVTNFAQLSADDRQAVAAYIKALPE